jgi:hypothetical protein
LACTPYSVADYDARPNEKKVKKSNSNDFTAPKIAYTPRQNCVKGNEFMSLSLADWSERLTLDQIADRVQYLINGWFYNHIMIADLDYVPLVKELPAHQLES